MYRYHVSLFPVIVSGGLSMPCNNMTFKTVGIDGSLSHEG